MNAGCHRKTRRDFKQLSLFSVPFSSMVSSDAVHTKGGRRRDVFRGRPGEGGWAPGGKILGTVNFGAF